jgi:hypothetical protein
MNLGSYDSLLADAASGSTACGYTLLDTARAFAADGGRGSFTAVASSQAAGCVWRARSSESWIRLTDVAGAGTATVNFALDANRTTSGRAGAVTIEWPDGAAAFTVKQDGLTNCRFALTPPAQTVGALSKDFSITVSPSDSSCSWKAGADVPWIAITGGNSNTGTGTVMYRVQANDTHAQRAGSITITGLISGSGAVGITQLP